MDKNARIQLAIGEAILGQNRTDGGVLPEPYHQKEGGDIRSRESVLASVNEAFDDFEKRKAENPDAKVMGLLFLLVTATPVEHEGRKATDIHVHAQAGGMREVLLPIAIETIAGNG